MHKEFQAIAARLPDYSKRAFEDAPRTYEHLIGAKSVEQVFEIQFQYVKKAYDTYIAEVSKLGQISVGLARNAYAPVEKAPLRPPTRQTNRFHDTCFTAGPRS